MGSRIYYSLLGGGLLIAGRDYMCALLQTILATKVPACFESPISGAQGNGLGFQARSRLTKIAKHLVIPMSEKSRMFRKLTVVLFTITLQGSCFKRTLTPWEGGGGGRW